MTRTIAAVHWREEGPALVVTYTAGPERVLPLAGSEAILEVARWFDSLGVPRPDHLDVDEDTGTLEDPDLVGLEDPSA